MIGLEENLASEERQSIPSAATQLIEGCQVTTVQLLPAGLWGGRVP